MGDIALKVRANDLERQWEDVRDEALEAIDRVGRSGWLVLGEEVRRFEDDLAAWWGIPYTVGVASGLDAIEIALRGAGITAGDRVLTNPLTAFATTLAVVRAGAQPVWCDVDESRGIDLDQVKAVPEDDPSIRAVLPVHLYGHPADSGVLESIAIEYNMLVIEDCAQSADARRDGRTTGAASVPGIYIYPSRHLGQSVPLRLRHRAAGACLSPLRFRRLHQGLRRVPRLAGRLTFLATRPSVAAKHVD